MNRTYFNDDDALVSTISRDKQKEGLEELYKGWRDSFIQVFSTQYRKISGDTLISLFHKSLSILWEEIRTGQEIQRPLSQPIFNYLIVIGDLNGNREKIFEEHQANSRSKKISFPYLAKKILIGLINQKHPEVGNGIALAYKEPAIKILTRSFGNRNETPEEIYGEALVGLLGNPPKDEKKQEATLFTYFMRIFRNKYYSFINRNYPKPVSEAENFEQLLATMEQNQLSAHQEEGYFDYAAEKHDTLLKKYQFENESDLLDELLKELKPESREYVKLKYIEELQSKEIAERFGVTDTQVRSTLSRAMKKLRALLDPKQDI